MTKGSSLRKKQKAPKNLLPRLMGVMALLALVVFGGIRFLNNGLPKAPSGGVSLSSPKNGQKIWQKSQEPVRFEWSGNTGEDVFLEISRDHDFHDLVLEEAAPKFPFLTDKLPGDGDYYYRIVKRSSKEGISLLEPIAFTVVTQSPPHLIYPFNPMSVPETKALRFYWQAKSGVNHYRFQIAFDNSFENLFSDLLLDETQTIPQKIPTGHFFWRVRGEDNPTTATMWSEVRVLISEGASGKKAQETLDDLPERVAAARPQPPKPPMLPPPPTPAAPIATPTPTTPPVAVKIRNTNPPKSLASPKVAQASQKILLRGRDKNSLRNPAAIQSLWMNPPTLSWNKLKAAASYEVQVSRKINFTQLEWTKSLSAAETKWELAKPGKFFWRVQALDESGIRGPFSSPSSLDLSLPAPKLKKLISHTVAIKTQAQLSARSPLPISWTEVPAASGYRVLVSSNKKFNSNMFDLKVDRNLASLDIYENGRYFVKVAVLGANGEPASDFSEVATIEYQKKNLIPSSTPIPIVEKKVTIPAPQLKLPPDGVSIVSLNGSQDPISFKWEDTDADAYNLEIAADEGFQQIIHSAVIRENQTVITKAMPKGKVYWRLRSKKGAIKSDWSPSFSFEFAK
jgi:hypothetical protein